MKTYLLLFIFLGLSLSCIGQTKKEWEEILIEKTKEGTFYLEGKELLQGDYTLYREDKSYEKIHFTDGLKHGAYTEYSAAGYKMREGNYRKGQKDGIWLFFNEDNGELYAEITYREDKKNGTFKEYNTNKVVVSEGNFLNDIKDGIWREYDSFGRLEKSQMYNNGKLVADDLKE